MYLICCVLCAAAAALLLLVIMTAMVGSGIGDGVQFTICAGVGYVAGLLVREIA